MKWVGVDVKDWRCKKTEGKGEVSNRDLPRKNQSSACFEYFPLNKRRKLRRETKEIEPN